MPIRILHWIVALPWCYDLLQFIVHGHGVHDRLERQLANRRPENAVVVDFGGGTGTLSRLWPEGATYICMDIDAQKLKGFHDKFPGAIALQSDGVQTGIKSNSVDVVMVEFVLHHIRDEDLSAFLGEITRILKPSGFLLFVDGVYASTRWISRLLWHFDRGSHPRTYETIQKALKEHFEVRHWDEFARIYACVIAVCETAPRPTTNPKAINDSWV